MRSFSFQFRKSFQTRKFSFKYFSLENFSESVGGKFSHNFSQSMWKCSTEYTQTIAHKCNWKFSSKILVFVFIFTIISIEMFNFTFSISFWWWKLRKIWKKFTNDGAENIWLFFKQNWLSVFDTNCVSKLSRHWKSRKWFPKKFSQLFIRSGLDNIGKLKTLPQKVSNDILLIFQNEKFFPSLIVISVWADENSVQYWWRKSYDHHLSSL